LRIRLYIIVCSIVALLGLLGGSAVASAHARHHRRHHRHHHRHRAVAHQASVLPYMGPTPSPSLFGINTLGYDHNYAYFKQGPPTARQMGARWVHYTNASAHFENGQPNWHTLDWQITQARKLGLGVLISLGGTPNGCSRSSSTPSWDCPPTTPGERYTYSLFLRSELLRYRNVVQYYESWLEPNGRSFADPAQYALLLQTQYQVFQQVNSEFHTNLKLLFGGPISFSTVPGSGGGIAVLPFTNQVLNDLHGARAFDAIGLHGYRFPSSNNGPADLNWGPSALDWDYVNGLSFPDGDGCSGGAIWCRMTWPQELKAYEQLFEDHGYGQMPMWLTEFGWPGNANPTSALYPSFDTQAQYLSEAYNDILHLPFIQAAFVFDLRDYEPGLPSPDPAFFYHYGLLQYGYQPKPAANVYEQFVQANPGR
jgi:polysaccharide biosynthesis protein PslG